MKGREVAQRSAIRRSVSGRSCRELTVVDLFCGAGGFAEGFRQAGFKILAGSDNDPDALATFALNFPEATAILGDVRRNDIRQQVLGAVGQVDVIVGGPPCQAFSQVRNHSRLIDDPRNSLYREFVDLLREALPTAFVMENVTGIDQMGVREQMLRDLSVSDAYEVQAQIVNAADFGVPQTRKRLLFVGVKRNTGIVAPTFQGTGVTEAVALTRFAGERRPKYQLVVQQNLLSMRLAEALADAEDLSAVSAEQAISDLAGLPTGNRKVIMGWDELPEAQSAYQRLMRSDARDVASNVEVPRMNRDTELRLQSIPKGGNHRDLLEYLRERYLTGQRWGQANGTGQLSRKHFYAYRRLHPELWAWTVNTKADCIYHYAFPRALSVREFARLQSFPDRFQFITDPRRGQLDGRHDGGPGHSLYRQVGNAVPPLLARRIAEGIKLALEVTSRQDGLRSQAG